MSVKMTGAEFKRFYSDAAYWDNDSGEVWHEEEEFLHNGKEPDGGIDVSIIADDDVITIAGGIVFGLDLEGKEPSFETYFKRWRKAQNTVHILVECDKSKLDAVKAAITAAGGRVTVR